MDGFKKIEKADTEVKAVQKQNEELEGKGAIKKKIKMINKGEEVQLQMKSLLDFSVETRRVPLDGIICLPEDTMKSLANKKM